MGSLLLCVFLLRHIKNSEIDNMAFNADTVVSILPQFEIDIKTDFAKLNDYFDEFYKLTANEEGCVNYAFGISDDKKQAVCRESYKKAADLATHISIVNEHLAKKEEYGLKMKSIMVYADAANMPEMREILKDYSDVCTFFTQHADGLRQNFS